jgi:hypothetical protein
VKKIAMPQTPIDQQPVTQITIIEAELERRTEALSLMRKRAHFTQGQPGGSFQLACIAASMGVVLRAAHQSPAFREAWSQFEGLTDDIDAHLYGVTEILHDKP